MLHDYIVGFDSFWRPSNDISRLLIEGDVRDLGIRILLEWVLYCIKVDFYNDNYNYSLKVTLLQSEGDVGFLGL